jgi:hypothetical protein
LFIYGRLFSSSLLLDGEDLCFSKLRRVEMRDTIDMARESWIDVYGLGHDRAKFIEALKHFEALVRADERNRTWTQEHWTEYERSIAAAEREACAMVCTEIGGMGDGYDCAAAIRARGENT